MVIVHKTITCNDNIWNVYNALMCLDGNILQPSSLQQQITEIYAQIFNVDVHSRYLSSGRINMITYQIYH